MDVWLPPGEWFELHTGALLSSKAAAGTSRSLAVHLYDTPIYAKGGAVVPRKPPPAAGASTVGLAAQQYSAIEWAIYPGAASGNGTLQQVGTEDGSLAS